MKDTRSLFIHLTDRKTEWEDMHCREWADLPDYSTEALLSLPRLVVPAGCSSFDSHPGYTQGDVIEHLVFRAGHTYYVNSEGYDYARYGFRVLGCPAVVPA